MDMSILGSLFEIAPDLMQEVELRALILERVAALGPIGRRALAARLHLAEREVRAAADALKRAGCITQGAAGMALTGRGQSLIETAKTVSRSRRSLSSVELTLSRRLNAARVCVVRGDADMDETVLEEAAHAAAQQIRFLLQEAHVLAVGGGQAIALTAQAIDRAAPMDIAVVPAHGGTGERIGLQANTLAEAFAQRLGGYSRMLYWPEGLSQQAAEELARLPQVREAVELARHADVLLYSIGRAMERAAQLGMSAQERDGLEKNGAIAEAAGFFFDAQGVMVGARGSHVLREQDMGRSMKTAAVAVGHSRAEAIMAVCAHHEHGLLVIDEGAAHRMMELLRV